MIITYRDELGVISIADIDNIQFDGCRAYFTDEDGTDFKVNVEHIISIVTREFQSHLCGFAE